MRKTHKAQHWIPRSYLASWTDPETPTGYKPYNNLVTKDGRSVKQRAPENLFTETDFYTIISPDGSRNLQLEHGLRELEQAFATTRRDFLEKRRSIPFIKRMKLLLFVAAMHARTRVMRDHVAGFFKELKDVGEEIETQMRRTSQTELPKVRPALPSSCERSMDLTEVKEFAAHPMANMLMPFIAAEAPLLARMRCVILCTTDDPGFVTSDAPVVWFDPEAYKKPPIFRAAAFNDQKLEITLPISPNQLLMFVHGDPTVEYVEVSDSNVSELNRRTRFYCSEYFIIKRAYLEPHWFNPGVAPQDSWRNTNRDVDEEEDQLP